MAKQEELQPLRLAKRMAKTSMSLWAVKGPAKDRFQYELGVFLRGIELVYEYTNEPRYLSYIKFKVDRFVADDGTITYDASQRALDDILTGRLVLMLYEKTTQQKYKKAAEMLINQLMKQPRTREGGFWHKHIYPNQMWLDGLYMAEPFYAEYAKLFEKPDFFDDIAKQFILMEEHSRDPSTGLLYHGYDESRQERWSDHRTGDSPSFWGRAVGWYFMAVVDTLEFFPEDHPKRSALLAITMRIAKAVRNVQDKESGLWWQVLDAQKRRGNYLESSASAMFVYSYARGVRKQYLPREFLEVAEKGYAGIVNKFVKRTSDGGMNYKRIASVGGLGGTPYRNGTFEYYISERIVANDPKGVGPFMMASVEMSRIH
jgi:unsaturated rhamnogalacturonyl hydrolase